MTSVLCDDKLAGNYKFKKLDPITGTLQLKRGELESRCKTTAYDMQKSRSQRMLAHSSSKVVYGSAKIQGFVWEDYACINPL